VRGTEGANYWNFSLFFPVAAVRVLRRMVARSSGQKAGQLHASPQLVNTLLYSLLRAENHMLLQSFRFPFGVSAFAVASRPHSSG